MCLLFAKKKLKTKFHAITTDAKLLSARTGRDYNSLTRCTMHEEIRMPQAVISQIIPYSYCNYQVRGWVVSNLSGFCMKITLVDMACLHNNIYFFKNI